MANLLSTTVNGSLNVQGSSMYVTASQLHIGKASSGTAQMSFESWGSYTGAIAMNSSGAFHWGGQGNSEWYFKKNSTYNGDYSASGTTVLRIASDGNIYSAYYGDWLSNVFNSKQNASTAITTSNIGSQSVNYASSAGNADTVDGYHASSFTYVPTWTSNTQSAARSNFVSGGNWYRIANLGTERFFARVRIYDDSSGGPHSSVEFQVAGAFNASGGYSFNLTSNGYYSAPSVTQVRILSKSTYDPQYLEVYISYVGYVPATFVVSLLEARNASVVNWDAGSIPAGYSATTWDANAPLAVGGRPAIFNSGIYNTSDYSRLGNVLVGQGTYKNTIKPIDDANLNIQTPSGAVYFDTYGQASGSFRAPIFYDSGDTGYYLDPNDTSNLNQLNTATRTRWNMPRYWTNRTSYTSDEGYWTGTNGWGTNHGTWASAWQGGFSGWDIWGTGTDHPQGAGYVHAQGIVSGQHYANSSVGYGWMMVGAANATANRYWLRGKWDTTTSGWVEMITTGNIASQSVSYADESGYSASSGSVEWTSVQNKPATFAPSAHTHDDRYYTESESDTRYAYKEGSSGTNFYANAYYQYEWTRIMGSGSKGIYWQEGDGAYWHIYPRNQADMRFRTGSGDGGIVGTVADETARGYIHWTTSNEIGFLSEDRSWVLRTWNRGVEVYGSMRAPIFYDSNDTTYYGDFAGTSWLRHLSVGDVNAANDGGWNARLNLTGSSHARLDVKSNSDGIITTIYSHTGQGVGRVGTSSNHPLAFMVNGGIAGYAYANYLQGVDSVRAPIFYDSNDTGYYLDPNGTSNLLTVNVLNTYVGNAIYFGGGNNYFNWDGARINSNVGIQSTSDMRAPIFYDSNDTGYYGNFAGFSRMSEIGVTNQYVYNYDSIESGRTTAEFGSVGKYVATRNAVGDYPSFSFEHVYGTFAWGQIARFHIRASGQDRPSIQFSSGSSNDRWNIGFCTGVDNNFRISQNMGYRPDNSGVSDGWGTERFRINTDGSIYISSSLQAYSYQGHSNVAGTGNASYHPSGIYSTGTNWLYGTMYMNNNSIRDVQEIYNNGWFRTVGHQGLYNPTNDAHFYPNNASYGSWRIDGTRNGWHGLHFNSGSTLMMNSAETGIHREGYGWQFRWYNGSMYVSRGTYGGGTEYTVIDSGTIGSQSVSYASSAGGVSWANVSSKPATWLNEPNLIQGSEPDTIRASGFYESYLGSGNPTGTWMNYINVRHSNTANGHGFQLGMSYYDNNLWFRSYSGNIPPSFQSWSRALGTNTDPYPSNMNQYVRTTDDVTHNSTTSPTFVVNNHSDNTKGYRIHNTSGSSVSAMFTNSSNQLVIAAGAFDQINLNKKVYVNGVALGVNVSPSATAGRIDASNDIVAYSSSDERLKYNITPIENAIDKVKSLTGVEFDWKPEYKHAHGYEGHDTGIIAQQVQEVIPSAVRTNDTGFLAVRYEKLIGLLVEGMKEQQAQIEELKAKLDGLTK